MVERLFLAVPRGCLQFVVVVFSDHTHLLFWIEFERKIVHLSIKFNMRFGAQENRLIETVLFSNHSICFG